MSESFERIFKVNKECNIAAGVVDLSAVEDENYIKGEILSNPNLSWISCGPRITTINNDNGSKRTGWTFGWALGDKTYKIVCVKELPLSPVGSPILIVACHGESPGSSLCFYHSGSSRVLKAIHFNDKITSLEVISKTNTVEENLSELLQPWNGIVAVGTGSGKVYLVDIWWRGLVKCTDDFRQKLYDEQKQSKVAEVTIQDLVKNIDCRTSSIRHGSNTLALWLNERTLQRGRNPAHPGVQSILGRMPEEYLAVSALKYFPKIFTLAVGYNTSCFQLWDLATLTILYTSPLLEAMLPVFSFGLLEPSDDPRYVCYLWSLHHSVDEDNFPFAGMYILSYHEKHQSPFNKETYYEGFSSCSIRYQLDLGTELDNVVSGRIISCQSIHRTSLKPSPVWIQPEVDEVGAEDNTASLLSIVWEVWCPNQLTAFRRLTLFDLNQWYREYMPQTSDMDYSHFMTHFCVPDGPLLDAKIVPSTIRQFSTLQPVDEHFYPSAMSFECLVLQQTQVLSCVHIGIQEECLQALSEGGPSALLLPARLHKMFTSAGIKPLLADLGSPNSLSSHSQREYLLCVALEYEMIQFLRSCVCDWADGSHAVAGCTLPSLLHWAWGRVQRNKKWLDRLCVPLFDYSGTALDTNDLSIFHHMVNQLHRLDDLFGLVLQKYRNCIIPGNFEQQQMAINLVSAFYDAVLWFVRYKVLPEINSNEANINESVPYFTEKIINTTISRRAYLHQVAKSLKQPPPTSGLFLIDAVIAQEADGNKVTDQWEREGGSTTVGKYPPPSVQSLLRTYLVRGIPSHIKHFIVSYFLYDIVHELSSHNLKESVKQDLLKYPSDFGLTESQCKIINAFWCLDHEKYEDGINLLLDSAVDNEDLQLYQHRTVLSLLVAAGKHKLALHYLNIRKPTLIDDEDIKLKMTLLLLNNLIHEAFQFQRQHQNLSSELLQQFFTGCVEMNKLDVVFKLPINLQEEEAFMSFLEKTSHPQADDMRVLYLLSRSRYVEAIDVNEKLRSASGLRQGTAKLPLGYSPFGSRSRNMFGTKDELTGAPTKAVLTTRDLIINSVAKSLPSVTRELATFCTKEKQFSWKQVKRPTPLSVIVHTEITNERLPHYKASDTQLVQAALAKTRETWAPLLATPAALKRKLNSIIEDTPFLRTPFLSRLDTSGANLNIVCESRCGDHCENNNEEQRKAKRAKLESTPLCKIVDNTLNRSTVMDMDVTCEESAALLHTPLVAPIIKKPVKEISTPHSILKGRSNANTPVTPARSDKSSASPAVNRQIRFSLPTENSSSSPSSQSANEEEEEERLSHTVSPRKSIHESDIQIRQATPANPRILRSSLRNSVNRLKFEEEETINTEDINIKPSVTAAKLLKKISSSPVSSEEAYFSFQSSSSDKDSKRRQSEFSLKLPLGLEGNIQEDNISTSLQHEQTLIEDQNINLSSKSSNDINETKLEDLETNFNSESRIDINSQNSLVTEFSASDMEDTNSELEEIHISQNSKQEESWKEIPQTLNKEFVPLSPQEKKTVIECSGKTVFSNKSKAGDNGTPGKMYQRVSKFSANKISAETPEIVNTKMSDHWYVQSNDLKIPIKLTFSEHINMFYSEPNQIHENPPLPNSKSNLLKLNSHAKKSDVNIIGKKLTSEQFETKDTDCIPSEDPLIELDNIDSDVFSGSSITDLSTQEAALVNEEKVKKSSFTEISNQELALRSEDFTEGVVFTDKEKIESPVFKESNKEAPQNQLSPVIDGTPLPQILEEIFNAFEKGKICSSTSSKNSSVRSADEVNTSNKSISKDVNVALPNSSCDSNKDISLRIDPGIANYAETTISKENEISSCRIDKTSDEFQNDIESSGNVFENERSERLSSLCKGSASTCTDESRVDISTSVETKKSTDYIITVEDVQQSHSETDNNSSKFDNEGKHTVLTFEKVIEEPPLGNLNSTELLEVKSGTCDEKLPYETNLEDNGKSSLSSSQDRLEEIALNSNFGSDGSERQDFKSETSTCEVVDNYNPPTSAIFNQRKVLVTGDDLTCENEVGSSVSDKNYIDKVITDTNVLNIVPAETSLLAPTDPAPVSQNSTLSPTVTQVYSLSDLPEDQPEVLTYFVDTTGINQTKKLDGNSFGDFDLKMSEGEVNITDNDGEEEPKYETLKPVSIENEVDELIDTKEPESSEKENEDDDNIYGDLKEDDSSGNSYEEAIPDSFSKEGDKRENEGRSNDVICLGSSSDDEIPSKTHNNSFTDLSQRWTTSNKVPEETLDYEDDNSEGSNSEQEYNENEYYSESNEENVEEEDSETEGSSKDQRSPESSIESEVSQHGDRSWKEQRKLIKNDECLEKEEKEIFTAEDDTIESPPFELIGQDSQLDGNADKMEHCLIEPESNNKENDKSKATEDSSLTLNLKSVGENVEKVCAAEDDTIESPPFELIIQDSQFDKNADKMEHCLIKSESNKKESDEITSKTTEDSSLTLNLKSIGENVEHDASVDLKENKTGNDYVLETGDDMHLSYQVRGEQIIELSVKNKDTYSSIKESADILKLAEDKRQRCIETGSILDLKRRRSKRSSSVTDIRIDKNKKLRRSSSSHDLTSIIIKEMKSAKNLLACTELKSSQGNYREESSFKTKKLPSLSSYFEEPQNETMLEGSQQFSNNQSALENNYNETNSEANSLLAEAGSLASTQISFGSDIISQKYMDQFRKRGRSFTSHPGSLHDISEEISENTNISSHCEKLSRRSVSCDQLHEQSHVKKNCSRRSSSVSRWSEYAKAHQTDITSDNISADNKCTVSRDDLNHEETPKVRRSSRIGFTEEDTTKKSQTYILLDKSNFNAEVIHSSDEEKLQENFKTVTNNASNQQLENTGVKVMLSHKNADAYVEDLSVSPEIDINRRGERAQSEPPSSISRGLWRTSKKRRSSSLLKINDTHKKLFVRNSLKRHSRKSSYEPLVIVDSDDEGSPKSKTVELDQIHVIEDLKISNNDDHNQSKEKSPNKNIDCSAEDTSDKKSIQNISNTSRNQRGCSEPPRLADVNIRRTLPKRSVSNHKIQKIHQLMFPRHSLRKSIANNLQPLEIIQSDEDNSLSEKMSTLSSDEEENVSLDKLVIRRRSAKESKSEVSDRRCKSGVNTETNVINQKKTSHVEIKKPGRKPKLQQNQSTEKTVISKERKLNAQPINQESTIVALEHHIDENIEANANKDVSLENVSSHIIPKKRSRKKKSQLTQSENYSVTGLQSTEVNLAILNKEKDELTFKENPSISFTSEYSKPPKKRKIKNKVQSPIQTQSNELSENEEDDGKINPNKHKAKSPSLTVNQTSALNRMTKKSIKAKTLKKKILERNLSKGSNNKTETLESIDNLNPSEENKDERKEVNKKIIPKKRKIISLVENETDDSKTDASRKKTTKTKAPSKKEPSNPQEISNPPSSENVLIDIQLDEQNTKTNQPSVDLNLSLLDSPARRTRRSMSRVSDTELLTPTADTALKRRTRRNSVKSDIVLSTPSKLTYAESEASDTSTSSRVNTPTRRSMRRQSLTATPQTPDNEYLSQRRLTRNQHSQLQKSFQFSLSESPQISRLEDLPEESGESEATTEKSVTLTPVRSSSRNAKKTPPNYSLKKNKN